MAVIISRVFTEAGINPLMGLFSFVTLSLLTKQLIYLKMLLNTVKNKVFFLNFGRKMILWCLTIACFCAFISTSWFELLRVRSNLIPFFEFT
jgi:hypothetical protein